MTPRESQLSVIVVRLLVDGEACVLLLRHEKWGDWGMVGGHIEEGESARDAAARELSEELVPLKVGQDVRLSPLLARPLTWGPVASRSAQGLSTTYLTHFFYTEFLTDPERALRLVEDRRLVFVPETALDPADWPAGVTDVLSRLLRDIGGLRRIPLGWSESLSSEAMGIARLPVDAKRLQSAGVSVGAALARRGLV